MRDSVSKTFLVAGVLCIVASVVVSGLAVGLQPLQDKNALLDKYKNILEAAGLYEEDMASEDITNIFQTRMEASYLEIGAEKTIESLPENNPMVNFKPKEDLARIGTAEKYQTIYKVIENDELQSVILPVEGKGLWSTMKGYLALENDYNTVKGITFYSHGETPGLGGEIDNPLWKAKWPGREVLNDELEPAIELVKSGASSPEETPHKIDALSGATMTSDGVEKLVQFWMGEQAFGPYLKEQIQSDQE